LTASVQHCIDKIKEAGIKVGLAIKPKTELSEDILEIIKEDLLDMVLIMTVEPGFGGQSFMDDMMRKVKHKDSSKEFV
jgi:ribulose-phosphate 3-epimerase